jgi:hypothetical protein
MATSFTDFNVGSTLQAFAVTAQNGVAAGTGDNTELTSSGIDRIPVGLPSFQSGILAVGMKTSLTAAATLSLTVKISESDDNSSWGADTTLINAEVQSTGAQTNQNLVRELAVDLQGRKRYVRFKVTLDLSAGATDTFVYGATFVAGGSNRLPV